MGEKNVISGVRWLRGDRGPHPLWPCPFLPLPRQNFRPRIPPSCGSNRAFPPAVGFFLLIPSVVCAKSPPPACPIRCLSSNERMILAASLNTSPNLAFPRNPAQGSNWTRNETKRKTRGQFEGSKCGSSRCYWSGRHGSRWHSWEPGPALPLRWPRTQKLELLPTRAWQRTTPSSSPALRASTTR